MADKEQDLKVKIDNVSFEEDDLKFCQEIYEEASGRYEELRGINIENRMFFEGQDSKLEERMNDTRVVRSALFVHELTPAIETRIGEALSRLEEREFPVTVRPRSLNPTTEEKDAALWVERNVTRQLRECGYLTDICKEHWTAAEIYHTPAALKVGWEQNYQKVAVTITPTIQDMMHTIITERRLPRPRVEFQNKYTGGRPYVEYLYPEEFLYQPFISVFQRDSLYVIHAVWLPKHEIVARAKEFGYSKRKLDQYFEDCEEALGGDEKSRNSERDEIAAKHNIPYDKGYKDGKYLLTENYIVTLTDAAEEVVHQVVVVGNKKVIKNRKAPHQGIKLPFVLAVSNRLPGTIEQMSSVDKGKYMQRLYNECFNSYLDGVTYRIFPPFKAPLGFEFDKQPTYGPAEIWRMANPDDLKPVIENPGQLPDLVGIMAAISAKIRDSLNAIDISQGFQSQQYEKATSTKLRAAGSSRRSTATHKQYGQAIIEVTEMFIALNQQHGEEPHLWVGDFVIDVPSLTSVSDPEQDKQESLLLYAQAREDPMFQNPIGQKKLRNMWEEIVRQYKKTNIGAYTLSEEELQQIMGIQAEMEKAAMEKQSAMEQLSIEQQNAPQETKQTEGV